MIKSSKTRAGLSVLLATVAMGSAGGMEILDARLVLDPVSPYVNQEIALTLEVTTATGVQLRDVAIAGILNQAPLQMGELIPLASSRVVVDGREKEVHGFRGTGRGLQPFHGHLDPLLTLTLVQRRAGRFSMTWSSRQHRLRLPGFALRIRELPAQGQPEGFAGAVGRFRLEGWLAPEEVVPLDLVRLNLQVSGRGYLAEALPRVPETSPDLFRAYAPEVDRQADNRLHVSRVIIPLSTQAVEIGKAFLPYFDPEAECYRVATAGNFRLRFTDRVETEPELRHLPAVGMTIAPAAQIISGGEVRAELRRVLPYAGALLAALLGMAILRVYRPRLALPLGVLLFVAATLAGMIALRRWEATRWLVRDETPLRIAPGPAARVVGTVPGGAPAIPLEQQANWLRIEAWGRRGWVPRDRVARSRNGGNGRHEALP